MVYDALRSLAQILHQTLNRDYQYLILDEKQRLESLVEEITSLQKDFSSQKITQDEETYIRDAAYVAEDIIESRIIERFRTESAGNEDGSTEKKLIRFDAIENWIVSSSSSASSRSGLEIVGVGGIENPGTSQTIYGIRQLARTLRFKAFVRFWRTELAEYLTILKVEQFSVEDVLKMEWKYVNSRIRKWRRAIKNVIGIFLTSKKRLLDQVLVEYGSVSFTCLVDASKASLLSLLNFGRAVAIRSHQPEWLFCLLDIYETLASPISDIEALFPEEAGSFIRVEFHELLQRLGNAAKVIFMELGNHIHIASHASKAPIANGGILPLTKYVVNYILCFAEYGGTLNSLLAEKDGDNLDMDPNENVGQTTISCPVAIHVHLLTSILEANLDIKSDLYRDSSLKHIFMMNNINCMVNKIKNSEVKSYFGDHWILKHIWKFRQHAMGYERVTWSSILDLIRDDGRTGKAALKERYRDFSIAFEDMYKIQTAWDVPNVDLREELRISASKTVIPAYRNFVGKITDHIGELGNLHLGSA